MQLKFWILSGCLAARCVWAGEFGLSVLEPDGTIHWTNAFPAGVVSLQSKTDLTGPWRPERNYFTSNTMGHGKVVLEAASGFFRCLAVDLSTNTPAHFTNLTQSYGLLESIAGRFVSGGSVDKSNYWRAAYEGGPATNAVLSRPHIAFADPANNILIVDEGSSSVLKVTPEGTIHTFAGTHVNGFNGDGPDYATNLHLHWPNGGWMKEDGIFFILDTYNGKLRRVDTNGIMTTVFTTAPMGDGRALWVRSDEKLVYFGFGSPTATTLMKWTPTEGVATARSGFGDLGNMLGDEQTGDLYLTDRNANRVYRLGTNGVLTPIAGTGGTTGGGDGFPALQTGLIQPRTICFLPQGGYFIGEHSPGNRIWYVDPAGIIRLWMSGDGSSSAGRGDGQWFYANPTTPTVSRVRSIVLDRQGNLILVENNYGYVRRIQFQRLFL